LPAVDRNERRNITAGQKAMGYARLFPDAERGGDRTSKKAKAALAAKAAQGFSEALLSKARTVKTHAPTWPKRSATAPL
jgi:hypothetical protein